jgi:predicted transposase YbfD/YdcC
MPYTPKKTLELLVAQGNDYLVCVKRNQPKLVQAFEEVLSHQLPLSQSESVDHSHGREVTRQVRVFAAPEQLKTTWAKAQSLVVVNRTGTRNHQPFATTSYYLSSLSLTALEFGLGIRQHRDIENGLHWVKDVIFQEDNAPFPELTPALNWSMIRSWTINLFRRNGYPSLTKAIRILGNNLLKLLSLLITN